MSGWIQFKGSVWYKFDAPYVTITCDRISNTDDSKSGKILVTLFNTSSKASQNYGNVRIIGSFNLDPLEGGYGYPDVKKKVKMQADVIYPYMVITVRKNIQLAFSSQTSWNSIK